MPPVQILVLAPFYRPHVGGVEAFVADLAAALDDEAPGAVVTTVLVPRLPPGAPAREREPHARVVRLPAVQLVANYPVPALWRRSAWRALRAATSPRPAVVVSHTRFFLTSALAGVVARVTGARWLHVEHGSDFVQADTPVVARTAQLVDLTLGRWVLRAADGRLAVSEAARAFVRALAGRDAIVLRRGVRPARLDAIAPSAELRERAGGRPVIAYVGRLIDGKGVGDLVDAVAGMRSDVLVCVVGDGPARAALEARAAGGPDSRRFAFLGERVEEDAIALLKAADVVVNPSHAEGLPTTVLLAAACGRPVVATDVGGTGEIITHGHTGLLVAPHDPLALRARLAELIVDPALCERLGGAARRDVRERFTWPASARAFLDLATRSPGR